GCGDQFFFQHGQYCCQERPPVADKQLWNGRSILRYYDVSPANNSSLNATLRFLYFDAELNGLDEAALGLWRSTTNVNWTYIGFDSRDASSNYVEKAGIASFSRWTLSTPAGALPLNFTTVNAACLNGTVRVSWSTSAEQLVSRFDIERTTGANDWTVAGSVAAAGAGNNSYTFNDPAPPQNAVYRVVDYDIDGRKPTAALSAHPARDSRDFCIPEPRNHCG
ncbi:MAG TPA: hypothetical protein VGB46_01765, partial [Flavisolibacter sp.]